MTSYKDIDMKELLKKFSDNYDWLYNQEDERRVAGYRDCLNWFDYFIDKNKNFQKFIGELVKKRGDFFSSDREIVALTFALDDLGICDLVENDELTEKKIIKESKLNKKDVIIAIKNAFKNGEEFDIPWKYSDEWEFTDAVEDELERQGFSFEDSFRDNKYGSVEEYSDNLETIYLVMDRSLSNRGICVGLVTKL